jgi:hypothetical protein
VATQSQAGREAGAGSGFANAALAGRYDDYLCHKQTPLYEKRW